MFIEIKQLPIELGAQVLICDFYPKTKVYGVYSCTLSEEELYKNEYSIGKWQVKTKKNA